LSSFGSFSLDKYSTVPDPEYDNISPKKNMEMIYTTCVSFAKDFPNYENLFFMGDTGLGKTHLALAIANEVLSKGYNVVYCSAANIFKAIETEYFREQHTTETLDTLKICDLLILDDLGAEYLNLFVNSSLYDIVNTRLVRQLPTIYTTNIVKSADIARRYSEKTYSRLIGCCNLLAFYGNDNRMK
ncbi:MAG: ATP-binding protein, partial [Oscillospiraceae bacterium]|nr:ATP-binding protein [Oscillospiraceae bacterium]